MSKRKPPRKKIRRAVGPVELPMSDHELLRDARRSVPEKSVVGGVPTRSARLRRGEAGKAEGAVRVES